MLIGLQPATMSPFWKIAQRPNQQKRERSHQMHIRAANWLVVAGILGDSENVDRGALDSAIFHGLSETTPVP